jgi:prepilin-type N-terminal cleavage/methylation domain-containing protein
MKTALYRRIEPAGGLCYDDPMKGIGMQDKQAGFTLLELIIVIILSLLILGLVMVYFANLLSTVKLQGTVRDFSTTLRQARTLAKINGAAQGVTINLDTKEYGLDGREMKKIPKNLSLKIIDPSAGEIQSGQYHLAFEPNWGNPNLIFQFTDKKKVISLALDPLSGAVVTK